MATTKTMLLALSCAALLPAVAMANGSIEGDVEVSGKLPAMGPLHREADPFCAKKKMNDEAVVTKGNKLENVWVHVAKGAKDDATPNGEVVVTQEDCMYRPRMQTALVGQKIVAKNGDPVLHNVHTYLGAATVFNKGMPNSSAAPITHTADKEGMLKWKCDVHPWMRGYVGVSKNKHQAITKDGTFKLDDVPAGKYTIEAWHEKFGAKTMEVTVEDGKAAKVTFKYDAEKDKA